MWNRWLQPEVKICIHCKKVIEFLNTWVVIKDDKKYAYCPNSPSKKHEPKK